MTTALHMNKKIVRRFLLQTQALLERWPAVSSPSGPDQVLSLGMAYGFSGGTSILRVHAWSTFHYYREDGTKRAEKAA
ncbi:hypothetical protein J7E78_00670 [Paenibacillus polymyxa]|uniref:hypothetical protein n=1 Tax=Paenibacillus polymyxa TaxID=1406 RepID=UPI001BE5A980|nr:hypothetical protein [Paenibacillus polymyxa]MBT2282073.1 hypothetical protein [Paenibacillus polymyxa]